MLAALAVAAAVWAGPAPASHLKVEVNAGRVFVYAYAEGSIPLARAWVTVSDIEGNELLTGQTDAAGVFSFRPPVLDDLDIEVLGPRGVVVRHRLHCRHKRAMPKTTAEQQACLDEIAEACALIEKGKTMVGRAKVFGDAQLEKDGRALCDQGNAALEAAKRRDAWCAEKAGQGCDANAD